MKTTNLANTKGFEATVDGINGIEGEIADLMTKCNAPGPVSDSVAAKVHKVAEQLLTAAGKLVDVGRDLKSVTSCMNEVTDDADDRDIVPFPHSTAWAGWTEELTADAFHAVDELIRAIGDLIGVKAAPTLKGGA